MLELFNFSSIIIIFPIFVAPIKISTQIIRIFGKIKILRIYEIADLLKSNFRSIVTILFQKNQIFDNKLFGNFSFRKKILSKQIIAKNSNTFSLNFILYGLTVPGGVQIEKKKLWEKATELKWEIRTCYKLNKTSSIDHKT